MIEEHRKFRTRCVILFLIVWATMAIGPGDYADWALENALVLAFALVMAATWNRFCLTPVSMALLTLFMCLHAVGAHYTYALVPYDDWWRALTGSSFNDMVGWRRNNFDRVVHFSYGLLLAYPVRELLIRGAGLRGFWSYFLPLDLTMSSSMMYELVEWGAAELLGGDLGQAYLGTQGDEWDAHKDMALASLGAFIAISLTLAIKVLREPERVAALKRELRFVNLP